MYHTWSSLTDWGLYYLWVKLGFHIRGKRKRHAAAVCEWYDSIHTFTHAFALSFLVWVKGNTHIWRHIHGFPNFRHPILYLLPHESLPGAIQFAAYAAIRKSHAVSGHMESPSSVYMLFHFCRITHNACRLRLPRIWNPSFSNENYAHVTRHVWLCWPGHIVTLHNCWWCHVPSHGRPSCCGTGSVHVLVRSCRPVPQVSEQAVHSLHEDQFPLTTTERRHISETMRHWRKHWLRVLCRCCTSRKSYTGWSVETYLKAQWHHYEYTFSITYIGSNYFVFSYEFIHVVLFASCCILIHSRPKSYLTTKYRSCKRHLAFLSKELCENVLNSIQPSLGQTHEWFREFSFSRLERGVQDRSQDDVIDDPIVVSENRLKWSKRAICLTWTEPINAQLGFSGVSDTRQEIQSFYDADAQSTSRRQSLVTWRGTFCPGAPLGPLALHCNSINVMALYITPMYAHNV